jgi:hypothetical protein
MPWWNLTLKLKCKILLNYQKEHFQKDNINNFPQIHSKPPSQSGKETRRTGITSVININNDNRAELKVGCIRYVPIKNIYWWKACNP